MLHKNCFAYMLAAVLLSGGFVPAEAQRGSITPLPEERDPTVWEASADVRYSHEWMKAKRRLFKKAQEEHDTATVVALAQEMAGGWLYNANAAYSVLNDAMTYLRQLGEEKHLNDFITLIRARAEVVQYMPAGDDSWDFLLAKIVCADYEIAQVYRRSGDHLAALHTLEQFYWEQQAHRTRLNTSHHTVHAECPLDDAKILSLLLEAYTVVALTTAPDPATAQGYMEAAMGYAETLRALGGPEQAFRWGNPTAEEAYGNPVWSIDSLLLFLARTIEMAPAPYVELVAALSKENTVRDPFSYGDAIAGREYMMEQDADENLIMKLYDTYQALFLGWEEAENGFEYQGNSLSYLSFAIERGHFEKAKELIAQLARLNFSDPVHAERFTDLQFAFQRAQSVAPAGLPMGNLVEGVLQAMQTGGTNRSATTGTVVGFTASVFLPFVQRHSLSMVLIGVAATCLVVLAAVRIRKSRDTNTRARRGLSG